MWIKDVEREIRRERGENRMQQQQGGGKVNTRIGADSRSDQRQTRLSKRETLLEMLMGAVVGGGGGSAVSKWATGLSECTHHHARHEVTIFYCHI